MCKVFIFLLLGWVPLLAADWVVTEGGVSPNKKLAVAVIPQKTEFIDEADDTVLLVDQVTGRKIGRLEEVSSSGGTWGTTTTNVRCVWSADSSILLVNCRAGRLMSSFQIYRIENRRAVPVALPDITKHPKARILEVLGYNANPGSRVSIEKDGTIVEEAYGFIPKEGHWADWEDEEYVKHGLKGFDGTLQFHYRFDRKQRLQLNDIKVPPPRER